MKAPKITIDTLTALMQKYRKTMTVKYKMTDFASDKEELLADPEFLARLKACKEAEVARLSELMYGHIPQIVGLADSGNDGNP